MRKIAANLIFTLTGEPLKNSYLVIDNDATIIEVVDTQGQLTEIASLEYYNGILVPGFIIETDKNTLDYPTIFYWNKGIQAIVNQTIHQPENKPRLIKKTVLNNTAELKHAVEIPNYLRQKQQNGDKESFEKNLKTFTINKAIELNLQNELGCFKPNTQPGVLLIYPFDLKKYQLTNDSKVQRLI